MNTAATTPADRWAAALDEWAHAMRRNLAPSTIERVGKQVRRFAVETGLNPFNVTPADVAAWDEQLDCSQQARYAYRTSLRTFYRWAYRAGRIEQDPTRSQGAHPLAKPVQPGWRQPLTDYRRWLRAQSVTHATVQARTERLERLARQTGAPDPWQVTDDDLVEWLAGGRHARETVRAGRSAVRSFYGWAHQTGRVPSNPARNLPVVRTSPPMPRPATEAQYRTALAWADPRAELMVRLAAELGLRRAEVAQVHSKDLSQDDQGGWWLVVQGKGGKLRRLPLPTGLSIEMRSRPPGWLFPGRDGHLSPRHVGKIVGRLLPEGVTMHALRHRFATRAYNIDRDVFAVQRFLGHASPATTQRYVQTGDDTMRALVEAVTR